MKTSIAVVVGASVLLFAKAAFGSWGEDPNRSLPGGEHHGVIWQEWLIRLGRSRVARTIPTAALERRLHLAGRLVSLEFVIGMKLALTVGTASLWVPAMAINPTTALFAAVVTAMAAFRFPDIALARRVKARLARISDQVSELADVLLVMTEAGVSPAVAFRRAADVVPDPLGSELGDVVRRLELGIPWRSALIEVAERTNVKPFKRLTRALTRSQRLGTSLASVLRTIADDLRGERRAQAEMAARQAPVKMLFPLVFLILPAFLLLTVGPVVLSTIRSLT